MRLDHTAWALGCARAQTLALVADVSQEQMCLQASQGEQHPAWVLGHLLLADSYLLFLLEAEGLPDDFQALLDTYGPEASPSADLARYDTRADLVQRLASTNARRVAAVRALPDAGFERPMSDAVLARTQPTIGHHLQSQVFHEGYHAGQLSAWRRAHGLPPVAWAFAGEDTGAW